MILHDHGTAGIGRHTVTFSKPLADLRVSGHNTHEYKPDSIRCHWGQRPTAVRHKIPGTKDIINGSLIVDDSIGYAAIHRGIAAITGVGQL